MMIMTKVTNSMRKANVFNKKRTRLFAVFRAKIIKKLQMNISAIATKEMFILVIGSIGIVLTASFSL